MLRGIKSEVPILKNSMIEHCCHTDVAVAYMGGAKTWEQAKGTLSYFEAFKSCNTYTTTLHVINSGIVKTSKLTFATKVYRGVSGMALPDKFWTDNEYGVKGGIEAAFMSTTKDRKVAMQYAASSGRGVVFEIQQGMIDRGADIGWLSQYPHEEEILFAPLTGLEVQSTSCEETVLVVGVSLSVNLSSLTIEQVIGKFRKLVGDAAEGAAI